MESIEVLRERSRAAQVALYAAEAIERDKANAALVGKCFKYHNSGGTSGGRWWLYMQIIAAEDGHLIGRQFQVVPMSDGRYEVRIDESYQGMGRVLQGFVEIKFAELARAWRETMKKAEALAPNASDR